MATDRVGIPIGWAIDGANRNDCVLFDPTISSVADRGLLEEIETLHLDKGYDNNIVRGRCADLGINDLVRAKRRKPGDPKAATIKNGPHTLRLRWPVERTNSWFSNYGQPRHNTDRYIHHRLAQICSRRRVHPRDQTHQVGRPLEPHNLTYWRAFSAHLTLRSSCVTVWAQLPDR